MSEPLLSFSHVSFLITIISPFLTASVSFREAIITVVWFTYSASESIAQKTRYTVICECNRGICSHFDIVSSRAGPYDPVVKQCHRFVIIATTGVCITVIKAAKWYIGKGQEERNAGKDEKKEMKKQTHIHLATYLMKPIFDF
jgi:hypothetical protein